MGEKMKLSILPCSLFSEIIDGSMSITDWFAMAEKYGFDGADISMSFVKAHSAKAMRELKEALEKVNIERVMVCTYPDLTNPDPLQRQRELAYLMTDIATCSQLGFKFLRCLAGQNHPGVLMEDMIGWAVEGLKKAGAFAKEQGVTLCFEDHAKPGAWDYIDITYDPNVFFKVLEGLKDTEIKINFDLGNITAFGEDPIRIMESCVDKIATIHVSDMKEKGTFDPCLVGTGACPLGDCFKWLNDHGFDGWY